MFHICLNISLIELMIESKSKLAQERLHDIYLKMIIFSFIWNGYQHNSTRRQCENMMRQRPRRQTNELLFIYQKTRMVEIQNDLRNELL